MGCLFLVTPSWRSDAEQEGAVRLLGGLSWQDSLSLHPTVLGDRVLLLPWSASSQWAAQEWEWPRWDPGLSQGVLVWDGTWPWAQPDLGFATYVKEFTVSNGNRMLATHVINFFLIASFKELGRIIIIICFMKPNISKTLFQIAINIKDVNEIFYAYLFCTESPKFNMHFILTGYPSS